ncbi:MAG: hypothetical protein CMG50_04205 [Candidatus Marinimicrobia bacterium]|nr:hypothetical protein [Candidatus Neomarinimicrobiota bacterium]
MLSVDFHFSYIFFLSIFTYLVYKYYYLDSLKIKRFRYLLISIRLFIIFFLTVLIINPNVKHSINNNKIIDIVVDNSKSMNVKSELLKEDINKIIKWGDKKSLSFNFYIFGDSLRRVLNINKITFKDNYTSFSKFFDNYKSDNNIFLLSDGLNNHGSENFDFDNFNPVNILGYGDENFSKSDISIELLDTLYYSDSLRIDVLVTSTSREKKTGEIYLNNISNRKVRIGAYDLKDKNNKKISLYVPNDKIDINNTIFINNENFESNYENNKFNLLITKDRFSKKKLLIISGSISQNTNYIKSLIKNNLFDYKINHLYRINKNLWNNSFSDYQLDNYDLVVFDDFPIYQKDNSLVSDFINTSSNKILYFLGPNNFTNNYILEYCNCSFSKLNKPILNELSNNFDYNNNSYYLKPNEVSFALKCDGEQDFSYDNSNSFISINNNIILFFIPNINDFKSNTSVDKLLFDDLVLSVIDNEIYSNNRLFELFSDSENINIDYPLDINLKFYDNLLINDLTLNIYKDNFIYKKIRDFDIENKNSVSKTLFFESSGDFLLEAEVVLNESKIASNIISISVNEINSELLNNDIDIELLSIISNNTNGLFYKNIDIDEFLENIEISNVNNVNYAKYDFKNHSYLLLILIVLLSLEWYVRNKVGLV